MRPFTRASGPAVAALLVLGACTQALPTPSPTATASAPPAALSPTPTATSTPTGPSLPTAAGTVLPTTVPLPSIALISPPTSDTVWTAVGGALLFRSTDRGDTWQQRPLPPSSLRLDGISFVSDREGWVLYLGEPAPQCQTQPAAVVELWHTTDAGATYERLPLSGITDEGCKGFLSFVDAQRGFIVASRTQTAPVIYRTIDGGRSWTASPPLAPPRGSDLDVGSVRAYGPELLVEALGTGEDRGHAIYRSTDGGASWNVRAIAPDLEPVAFVTASRWIRLLPDRSQETTDAGASWHAFVTDYTQAAPIAPAVVFADDAVGYATVRGTIQRTVDGGARWTALRTPGT